MRLLLWSLVQDHEEFPDAPPAGHVTVPAVDGVPEGYYPMAGYRRCGSRAVRIDMLERLADLIRPMDVRGGFEATQDMLSITGTTLDQFADLMGGLGFDHDKGERPKTTRVAAEQPAEQQKDASSNAPEAEVAAETAEGAISAEAPDDALAEPAASAAEDEAVPAETAAQDTVEEPETAQPGAATVTDAPTAPDAETPPEAQEASEGTEPGEPEIETFYIFRLRQRNRQGRGAPRGERQHKGGGQKQQRPRSKGPKGKRKEGGGPRQMEARPPKKEKAVDPDNPFAVLQQLKDR